MPILAVLKTTVPAQVGTICVKLGIMTNNQAEYIGLLTGILAAKRVGVISLRVLGDSQLVVRQARYASLSSQEKRVMKSICHLSCMRCMCVSPVCQCTYIEHK